MGEADDGPPGVMMGGDANGTAPGGAGGSLNDDDLPPDFDAEPMENFEPTKSTSVSATIDDAVPAMAVGDDDMD